jgi:hypothetical protein
VNTEIARVKRKTVRLTPISASRGKFAGFNETNRSRLQMARTKPTAPPSTARTMLSVRSSRMTRDRLAPSAPRMAISLCRAAARASSKFAMFAQAISKTKATAARSTISIGRTSPIICS